MKEIVKRIFEYQGSMYRSKVKIDLYVDSPDAYAEPVNDTVDVEYDLEFEGRTWGLKGAPEIQ